MYGGGPTFLSKKRSCTRYRLILPVLFSWREDVQVQNGGFTRDIGVDGVFVIARVCPPVGAEVKLELVLPVPQEPKRELRLRYTGRVVRVDDADLSKGFALVGDFGDEYLSGSEVAFRT
jgi:hypothetical protein